MLLSCHDPRRYRCRAINHKGGVAQVVAHPPTDQEVLNEAAELVHTMDDPEAVVQDEDRLDTTITIADTIADENDPVTDEPIDPHEAFFDFLT